MANNPLLTITPQIDVVGQFQRGREFRQQGEDRELAQQRAVRGDELIQKQIEGIDLTNATTRDNARIRSNAIAGAQLTDALEAGNTELAVNQLNQRIQNGESSGFDMSDSKATLQMVQSGNIDQALQEAKGADRLGQRLGQIKAIPKELQPKLPDGVKIPEGTLPIFDGNKVVGVKTIPGLEALAPKINKDTIEGEGKLRKEFGGITKDFRDIRDAFKRIEAVAEEPSAAGDLALIFNYMKMLDPGSTVREGEFANAQNSGGVNDRIVAKYNEIRAGQRLSEKQRTDFLDTSKKLFNSQASVYNTTTNEYRGIAGQYGFDPDRIAKTEEIIEIKTQETDKSIGDFTDDELRALAFGGE